MHRPVQYLSDDYIERSMQLSVMERLEFLEEYRLLLPISIFEEHKRERLAQWHEGNFIGNNKETRA